MPPDKVRDVVAVGMRTGRDRAEADGGQRGKRRDRTAVVAVLGEKAKHRRIGRLEYRRSQPVDDDEDDRLRLRLRDVSPWQATGARRGAPARGSGGVRQAPAPLQPRGTRARERTRARPRRATP